MKNQKIALLILGVYALSLIASAITVQPVQAAVAAGYSEYFIPGSTDQLFRIIQDNDNIPELGNAFGVGACATGTTNCNEMHNIISVSVATDNLKLYYDHWENGYSTGATGDEIYTANAGDVLVFKSGDILVPRSAAASCTSTNPSGNSTRCYDGRDRVFVAGGAVSLSQVFWPEAQGLNTVYSNAWEVYPVKPYQSSYTMPVGEDLVALGYTDFTNTYLIVQATQDNTNVVIDDPDKPGVQENKTLNRGEVTEFFHFNTGTTVNASAPVQVQFIVGQEWTTNQSSDTRSYTAVPDGLWASSYFSPVPGFDTNTQTDLYVHNPTAAPLTINFQDRTGSGSYTLAAGETLSYSTMANRFVPANSGVFLAAADGVTKFWAIGSYDTESANFNYGFTLIPPDQLTEEYFISWAWGSNNLAANGSPVFVTPVDNNTTIFVDYSPTDGVIDQQYTLNRLQIAKIRDTLDNNNTGMHVWATGPIAVVWGEDDEFADVSNPYIDAGYTILPLKQEWLESVLTMDKTASPEAVSAEIGSISEFTLTIQGYAYGLDSVWVYDDLPSGWAYVPGTTVITLPGGGTITGAAAEPSISGQELTWDKFPTAPLDMNPGEVLTIVYQARVDTAPTGGYVINESTVTGTVGGDTFTASDATTVYMVYMDAEKTSSAGGVVNPGDTITYTVNVSNTGGTAQNDLIINDLLPAGTTYVPQSTSVTYSGPPTFHTYRDTFSASTFTNSNGTVNWAPYAWVESGDNALPGSGVILIANGVLRFDGKDLAANITRRAPITGAASATLSFDYAIFGATYGAGDVVSIQYRNGGTGPFTELDRYDGNLPATGFYSRNITAIATNTTEIRILVSGFTGGVNVAAERVEIDNFQVQYSIAGPTLRKDNIPLNADANLVSGIPPALIGAGDNIDLPAGGTLTLTYQVKVDNPIAAGITEIVNTARVLSTELPDPLEATVSDRVRGVHLSALKTASSPSVSETGGSMTYTFTVTNNGGDPVTIATLTDNRFGGLPGDADCKVGTVLAAGASCDFTATFTLPAGNAGGTHVNSFTVTGGDGFGNTGGTSESETVTYANANPDISVTKSANPTAVPETGGNVTFTYTVTNNSAEAATITTLSDDRFGALPGDADCQVNTVLPGNGSCSFAVTFAIPAGDTSLPHTNIFTAAVRDDENGTATATDSETVGYTNVLPQLNVVKTANPTTVAETGGPVTYTFVISNTGVEPVTLGSFWDDKFGDALGELPGDADCQPGTVLAAGASCTYEAAFVLPSGDPGTTHVNQFTVQARDNENTTANFSDTETVTYTDVLPVIRLTKTASPASVPETGGPVTFTFLVENTGVEAVTLTALSDTAFGNLIGQGTCSVPQIIAAGGSYSCTVTKTLSSDTLTLHTNTALATAGDNEGNDASDDDDAEVTFTNVAPAITVSKTASPDSLPETGDTVTYTFTVTNDSAEAVTIKSLADSAFGTLNGDADCEVGTLLAPGGSCEFMAAFLLPASEAGLTHENVFTATVEDNEGSTAADDASETVTYTDVHPSIRVTKSANPSSVLETGEPVTFTFLVENTGMEAVTLTSLDDTTFGSMDGLGSCSVPQTIAAGGSYSCQYSLTLSGNTTDTHTNTITAEAEDNEGNQVSDSDEATVTFADALPAISVEKTANPTSLPETGGNVTYTFTVRNEGAETVTITELEDDRFGLLSGDPGCEVGTVLAGGASCSFSVTFALPAGAPDGTHVNIFTATAEDDESNQATDDDDATVTYSEVLPEITVTKDADQTTLPETGGSVTFTFVVENTGAEAVRLTSLTDTVFGDLNGLGDCFVPQDIAMGGSYTCQYTTTITGEPLADHENTVTANAQDNDGNTATATATETISFSNVDPAIALTKTASAPSVPETGAPVTFTFLVENTGQEAVTLTSLMDDVFGDLDGLGDCALPQTIAVGGSYSCQYTTTLAGDSLDVHTNIVTASYQDNDGNSDGSADSETVSFTNVAPDITVLKTAADPQVAETGGSMTYTFTVNNETAEPVIIDSLTDSVFGTLPGDADCYAGMTLAGNSSCTFSATFSLPASDRGDTHTNTFIVEASDNEGGSDTASDEETVTYSDVEPQVSVVKTAAFNEIAETGGDMAFTFTVTNLSQEPAMIMFLYDDVFGELEGDADCNTETTLAGGASCSFEATFNLLSGEPGDTHINVFTAGVMDDEENFAEASEDETITYTDLEPVVSVTKTAAMSTVVETGENVTFTFTVTNESLEDVTITALVDDQFGPLDGGAGCEIGTVLAPGETCSFETVLAIPAGTVGSTHVNTFTASVEDNDGSAGSGSDSETITYIETPAPAIMVLKEVFAGGTWHDANAAPGPQIYYGQTPQFRFTVRNTGNVTLTGITLTDSVYSTASCAIPASLSPDDSVNGSGTDEFSCAITAAWALGQHTNTATATGSYGVTTVTDTDDANYLGVNYSADLAVTKTDGVPSYVPGEPLTYTITVTNNGPDAVVGAVFSDAIPAQIARWTWTCAEAGGASGCSEVANSTANFTDTIDLPVGGSITYTVVAETRASATANLTNTASVTTPTGTDDTDPGNNSATDTDTAGPRANLTLAKTADAEFRPGGNLSYTITVTNNGPSDAAGVIVTDTLPNEVTYVSATPAVSSGPNPVTWNLGTIAAGSTRTIRLVVRVKDWVNVPFTNTASVTSATTEISVIDNTGSATAQPEDPTVVTLGAFDAKIMDGLNVLVEWNALSEVDHYGYKLYRTTGPVFENATLLDSFLPNPEKLYTYTDTVPSAGVYYYWLVDVSTIGAAETLHGPVVVIFNARPVFLPLMMGQ